jgi:hypothetical protein
MVFFLDDRAGDAKRKNLRADVAEFGCAQVKAR